MKKLLTLIVLFIALTIGNAASAQSIMAHTLTTADVEHVIVKSYNYPVTITSCNFKNTDVPSSMFIYSGADHKSLQIRLDSFFVNDFAIDNDTVFFCGQSWEGKGIIGFFNIQDLFFNSGSFRIQTNFDVYEEYLGLYSRPVEKLTKMVTYRMTGQKRHIVSIGYAQDVFHDGYHYCCIVDMYLDQRRPVSPWYYNSGTIHGSDSNYFKDITLAGNYVVTAGFEIDQYISMRLFKANDLFSTTGPQNTARVFYNGNNSWKKQDLLLTTVSNGALPAVATAAIRDISYSATYKPIHIATYDVSMLATGSSSSMTGSAVMNVGWYDSVRRLYDFIADPINEKFALLHLGENASSQKCCIFSKINYNLQSVARSKLGHSYCREEYHRGLQSIDRYNNSLYVLAGLLSNDSRELTYNVETAAYYANPCQKDTTCLINTSPLVSSININKSIDELGGMTSISYINRHDTVVLPIIIECQQ